MVVMGYAEEGLHCHSQSGEDSGEDGMSVLPRHTKVLVTGNNRTKSVLVGLHGVVTKAVGLGGWHWLVLTNGDEVKLQRNALSVVEGPTGHEKDDDNDDNPFSSETSQENNFPTNSFRVQPRKPTSPVSSNPGAAGNIRRAAQYCDSYDRKENFVDRKGLSSRCLPAFLTSDGHSLGTVCES